MMCLKEKFQSTYLYKVRRIPVSRVDSNWQFQSTYLYKVRQKVCVYRFRQPGFNPRTYIRYDSILLTLAYIVTSFNPRTYIRYDLWFCH